MVKEYFKNPICLSVLVLCFIFYSGIFNIPESFSFNSIIPKSQINEISGYIMSSPVKSSSGKSYSAKFKTTNALGENISSEANGIITVLIPFEMAEVYFPGKLYTKAGDKNCYLYETGGFYIFEGKFSNNFFIVSDCKKGNFNTDFLGKIDYFRAVCRLQFKRLMYKWGEAGGLLLALLCGAREYTNLELSESFRKAGLSHILALSGMHLSMFSSIALFIGNRIGRKKVTFLIRIVTLICFLWFAGFSPSLTRAFIFSMLLIFASIASVNEPDTLIVLCFTFILQSIMYPADIMNYGFMLSYGALTGILLTNKFFYKLFSKVFPLLLSSSLSSSSGAQIVTLPLSLKLFGSFSPIGVIATVFVSPLITIFIYSGLLLIIICLLFSPLVTYSGILLNFQYTIIKYLVGLFSMAPRITI